jgi:predicted transcriptional regulator
MKTWNDYKNYVKKNDPEIGKDIEDIENISAIISAMIAKRNDLVLSQRELASMCGIPQSSVARIESFKTTPNLATLIKILRNLGLTLKISQMA